MSAFDDAPIVEADDAATWRSWLESNHATASSAWLVTWRPGRGHPVLDYSLAVEEALCFGWVDSRGGSLDADRTKLYFAPRKPRSGWSASNKARIERLVAADRMHPAGLAAIERAKTNGSWTVLDAVERGEIPADLASAFDAAAATGTGPAAANFAAFPWSARRALLEWIGLAKRPETRAARILETATRAAANERANEWTPRAGRTGPIGPSGG